MRRANGVDARGRPEIKRTLTKIVAGGLVLCFAGIAYGSNKKKSFHVPSNRVFAAAIFVAKQDKATRELLSSEADREITFRVDVDEIGPPDRVLGEYWSGLSVRIKVSPEGGNSSLTIQVERVYPARFNNVPQRMPPHAEEEEYAKRFLKRVRSELGKSR